MAKTGRLDLVANRWEPFVHRLIFQGMDLTGAAFAAEVRDRRDGGFVRASLATVGSAAEQGLSLISVTNEDVDFGGTIGVVNVPVSIVSMRINEEVMEAMDVAEEAGEDGVIWWDMQVTPSMLDKYRALEGTFTVKAGSTGSGA